MCNLLTDVYKIVCNVYRIKHDVCGIVCNVYTERVSLFADGVQPLAHVYSLRFLRKSKILVSPCLSSTWSAMISTRRNSRPAHDARASARKRSASDKYNTRESAIVMTTDMIMKNTPAR